MTVTYDGTRYFGFQTQPDKNTIQAQLERAIFILTGKYTNIIASGRTDAGVHARKQVFNFMTESIIPIQQWCIAMNTYLPKDIVVINAKEVPLDFHARKCVKMKTYRYSVNKNRFPDVFQHHFQYHCRGKLDLEAIREALGHFIGTHNFTSFASQRSKKKDHIRTIFDAWIKVEQTTYDMASTDLGTIHLFFKGNGFLQHMVRIIVGTLLQVGEGRIKPSHIPVIIESQNRKQAGTTAPSCGLTLWDVQYEEK